jgi:hypothetical protein
MFDETALDGSPCEQAAREHSNEFRNTGCTRAQQ